MKLNKSIKQSILNVICLSLFACSGGNGGGQIGSSGNSGLKAIADKTADNKKYVTPITLSDATTIPYNGDRDGGLPYFSIYNNSDQKIKGLKIKARSENKNVEFNIEPSSEILCETLHGYSHCDVYFNSLIPDTVNGTSKVSVAVDYMLNDVSQQVIKEFELIHADKKMEIAPTITSNLHLEGHGNAFARGHLYITNSQDKAYTVRLQDIRLDKPGITIIKDNIFDEMITILPNSVTAIGVRAPTFTKGYKAHLAINLTEYDTKAIKSLETDIYIDASDINGKPLATDYNEKNALVSVSRPATLTIRGDNKDFAVETLVIANNGNADAHLQHNISDKNKHIVIDYKASTCRDTLISGATCELKLKLNPAFSAGSQIIDAANYKLAYFGGNMQAEVNYSIDYEINPASIMVNRPQVIIGAGGWLENKILKYFGGNALLKVTKYRYTVPFGSEPVRIEKIINDKLRFNSLAWRFIAGVQSECEVGTIIRPGIDCNITFDGGNMTQGNAPWMNFVENLPGQANISIFGYPILEVTGMDSGGFARLQLVPIGAQRNPEDPNSPFVPIFIGFTKWLAEHGSGTVAEYAHDMIGRGLSKVIVFARLMGHFLPGPKAMPLDSNNNQNENNLLVAIDKTTIFPNEHPVMAVESGFDLSKDRKFATFVPRISNSQVPVKFGFEMNTYATHLEGNKFKITLSPKIAPGTFMVLPKVPLTSKITIPGIKSNGFFFIAAEDAAFHTHKLLRCEMTKSGVVKERYVDGKSCTPHTRNMELLSAKITALSVSTDQHFLLIGTDKGLYSCNVDVFPGHPANCQLRDGALKNITSISKAEYQPSSGNDGYLVSVSGGQGDRIYYQYLFKSMQKDNDYIYSFQFKFSKKVPAWDITSIQRYSSDRLWIAANRGSGGQVFECLLNSPDWNSCKDKTEAHDIRSIFVNDVARIRHIHASVKDGFGRYSGDGRRNELFKPQYHKPWGSGGYIQATTRDIKPDPWNSGVFLVMNSIHGGKFSTSGIWYYKGINDENPNITTNLVYQDIPLLDNAANRIRVTAIESIWFKEPRFYPQR
jgi:hypothetical protein